MWYDAAATFTVWTLKGKKEKKNHMLELSGYASSWLQIQISNWIFLNGAVCFLNAITWIMKIMYVYSLLTKKKECEY